MSKVLEQKLDELWDQTKPENTFDQLNEAKLSALTCALFRKTQAIYHQERLGEKEGPSLLSHLAALVCQSFAVGHDWVKEYGPLW